LPYLREVPLHPIREEKELPSAVTMLVNKNPKSVFAYPLSEKVPDLTSVQDVKTVEHYLVKEFEGIKW
jgi:hypothetical protein